jgi:hypothetical protein
LNIYWWDAVLNASLLSHRYRDFSKTHSTDEETDPPRREINYPHKEINKDDNTLTLKSPLFCFLDLS